MKPLIILASIGFILLFIPALFGVCLFIQVSCSPIETIYLARYNEDTMELDLRPPDQRFAVRDTIR